MSRSCATIFPPSLPQPPFTFVMLSSSKLQTDHKRNDEAWFSTENVRFCLDIRTSTPLSLGMICQTGSRSAPSFRVPSCLFPRIESRAEVLFFRDVDPFGPQG